MKKASKLFIGIFLCLLMLWVTSFVSSAYAVTRNVVASGGSGTSDCTTTACTMSRANAVVQAGDVVSIANGTYTTSINPAVSGTAVAPITYRGASTGAVVRVAALSSKSYITLDNITFSSVQNGMITSNGSTSHLTITNCTFTSTDNGVAPTNYSYVGVSIQGDYAVVRDNTFLQWFGGDQVRINGDFALVENNDFSQADSGHGNLMVYGSNTIVRNNYFRNRWDRAWEISAQNGELTQNRLFENNIVFDSNWDGSYAYPASATNGGGGAQSGTDQIAKVGGSVAIMRNNLIVSSNIGKDYNYQSIFHIGNYGSAYWFEKDRIYHNTFHDNPRNGISMNVKTTDGVLDCTGNPANCLHLTDNVIKNNVISDQDYYSIWIENNNVPFSTHTFENNILTQSIFDRGATRDAATFDGLYSNANNNISTAPTFANPGIAATANSDPESDLLITFADFVLTSGSAGKGTGAALTTVTADATNATQISVVDAYYFFDGFGLETGDSILIGGDQRTVTDVVNKTTLQVTPAVTVANGDPIYLTAYGTTPDRGIVVASANVAPSVSVTQITDPNPDSTPQVTGTVSDSDGTVAAVHYQANSTSGTWTSCTLGSGTFTCNVTPALSEGINTIHVRATDDDGATTITSDSFIVDTVAPTVSITPLSPDPNTNPTPTLTGTATDANSTVAGVSYQVGGTVGTWLTCVALDNAFDEASEPFSCTVAPALGDGTYTIYFKATDQLSNATTSGHTSDTFELADTTATWRFNSANASGFTYDTNFVTVDDSGARPVSSVNKITNPAFSSDHSSWSVAALNAASGWAVVPGSGTYSTSDFYVMQYEAKYDCTADGDGDTATACSAAADSGSGMDWRDVAQTVSNVVSTANGAPIVHIRHNQATSACPLGTHLISNNEWMTIARNAEAQTTNWANGVVGSTVAGSGGLKRGNTSITDSASYTISGSPDAGTSRNTKAKLVLSNSSEIWDLSGNASEWVSDTIQRKDQPLAWNGTTDDSSGNNWSDFASGGGLTRYLKSYKVGSPLLAVNLIPSNATYTAAHGVGRIFHYSDSADTSTTTHAYVRGGNWSEGAAVGAFTMRLNQIVSNQQNTIGYRCASGATTTQTYSGSSGRSGGGETVTATGVADVKLYQSINVGDTSTYDLSVYVYDATAGNDGGTVSSSIAQLFYNGATVSTTYADAGSGWWKLTGTLTGANASREYGVLVEAGKTVKLDDFTLSKNGSYTIYNTTAHSVSGVLQWDGFSAADTASGNAAVKYQICTNDGSTCQSGSGWKYWDGDSWETASNTITHVNTEAELTQAAMNALPVDTEKISVKSIFSFGGSDTPDLDTITISHVTDAIAPTIDLVPYTPDPTNDTTPTVTGTATEAEGTVTSVEYKVGAGSWSNCAADDGTFDEAVEAFSCTLPTQTHGSKVVYVKATDSGGNTTPDGGESSDTFDVDITGPTTPGTPTTDSESDNPTPTWIWTPSTDTPAGLDTTPYTIEWSTTSNFSGQVTTVTDIPNAFTHVDPLADGTWYIRVKATDTLGNVSSYSSNGTITIDTTDPVPPTVSITDYTPDPGTDNTPSVTGTTSDSDSTIALVEFQMDSTAGLWKACDANDGAFDEAIDPFTCNVTTPVLTDGPHTINVRAVDTDFEYSSVDQDTFTVDTTAPVVAVTPYSPDPGADNTPTIAGTITDANSTVASIGYDIDSAGSWSSTGCSLGSGTFSCTISTLSDGSRTIRFRGTDSVGNVTSSNYPSDTLVVDTTAPTVPTNIQSESPENDTTPTWTWEPSSDSGAGLAGAPYTVQWSMASDFSGGNTTDTANTTTFTHDDELADGTWYFRVKAADAVNNQSAYSTAGSFIVDTTIPPTEPPTVSFTDISPDPGTDTTPTVTGTAADPDGTIVSVQYQVDSTMGDWEDCIATGVDASFDDASETFSCEVSPAVSQGAHTLFVRTTADDDQTADDSDTFTVDTLPPSAPGTPSTTTPTSDTTPTWTWTASTDSGVGLQVPAYTVQWSTTSDFSGTVLSSTATTATFTHSTQLANGTWYFRVRATDGINNQTSFTAAGSVLVDTTAPSAPGTPSTTSPTGSTSQNWAWTAATDAGSGVANYAWRVVTNLGAAVTNGTTSATSTATSLTQGIYNFFVKAIDNVGNESSESSGSVTVDTAAPIISLTPYPIDPTTETALVMTGTATDNLTALTAIEWRIGSGSWSACTAGDGAMDETSETFSCNITGLTDGSRTITVRATDSATNTTSSINYGSDTIIIDSTAPTTPGTPSSASSSDDSTPAWTWTASTDSGQGLASTPYTVQWSNTSDFSGTIISGTAATNSFTHTSALSVGTWYFRVRASDSLGNQSSFSSAGSFNYTGALALADVAVEVGENSAEITWSTNIAASTQVEYGLLDKSELTTSETDTSPRVTSHSKTISNLAPCTRYVYSVRSESAASNEVNSDQASFITDGCTGDTVIYEQTAAMVDSAEAATITLETEGTQTAAITVPENVSGNSDLVFQLFRVNRTSVLSATGVPAGFSSIVNNHVYELRALSDLDSVVTSFNEPITLTITYTSEGISGYKEDSLALYRWDGSAWHALDNCSKDAFANTISCTTTSFSSFAMFGVTTPSSSSSSGRRSSSRSNSKSDRCTTTPPASIPEIYQVNVTRTSAQLYINPAGGETTDYTVAYGLTPTDESYSTTFAQTKPSGAIVHTINLLNPNTTYYFKVRATNGCAGTGFGTVFAAKTARFFWQSSMITQYAGVFLLPGTTPAQTVPTTPTAPAAPTTSVPQQVAPVQTAPVQVTPRISVTPRPTPTSDTTRTIPTPQDAAPTPKPSWWQQVKNLVPFI